MKKPVGRLSCGIPGSGGGGRRTYRTRSKPPPRIRIPAATGKVWVYSLPHALASSGAFPQGVEVPTSYSEAATLVRKAWPNWNQTGLMLSASNELSDGFRIGWKITREWLRSRGTVELIICTDLGITTGVLGRVEGGIFLGEREPDVRLDHLLQGAVAMAEPLHAGWEGQLNSEFHGALWVEALA